MKKTLFLLLAVVGLVLFNCKGAVSGGAAGDDDSASKDAFDDAQFNETYILQVGETITLLLPEDTEILTPNIIDWNKATGVITGVTPGNTGLRHAGKTFTTFYVEPPEGEPFDPSIFEDSYTIHVNQTIDLPLPDDTVVETPGVVEVVDNGANWAITGKVEGQNTRLLYNGQAFTTVFVVGDDYVPGTEPGEPEDPDDPHSDWNDGESDVYYNFNDQGALDIKGRYYPNPNDTTNWSKKQTTYAQQGWHLYYNDTLIRIATDGVTAGTDPNIAYKVTPLFATIAGVDYLQVTMKITNNGASTKTFSTAWSTDIQIGGDDNAEIVFDAAAPNDTQYTMRDDGIARGGGPSDTPGMTMILRYKGDGCTTVDNMWVGYYNQRVTNLYNDYRNNITNNTDTGTSFGWKDITLEPGQSVVKSWIITNVARQDD